MAEVLRLFDLLQYKKNTHKFKEDILAWKENGEWVKYSIDQYIDAANKVSYALLALGLKPGDHVATISNSRPEWNFMDMGILQAGMVHVPIYPTISESDYQYILNHSEVKIVAISGKEILRKIEHILPEIKAIKEVFAFKETEGVKPFSELLALGEANQNEEALDQIKAKINSDDIATIIYTSGTTGNPKGVLLSHKNILTNIFGVEHIPPVGEEGMALSYLPLCHVYERMLNYLFQYVGISVYYAESPVTVADNLKDIKADLFASVPRLLEKVYDKILATGRKQKGIKKSIFFWALHLGLRYEPTGGNGFLYDVKLKIARKLVFSKWQAALGGNIKVIVSGGAALQPRLARIFWAAGIPVLEGYGLTETSPVIGVNSFEPGGLMVGSVGRAIANVEVKIAEDGEILTKGPCVMKGYFKEPELTREAIDQNGWFHTGDTGHIEKNGHIVITGRKKEIFKTSFGKYISPEMIENHLKESIFIDTALIVGENQKYAAALIVPDFTFLKAWCAKKGIPYTSNEEMIQVDRIQKRFAKEIMIYNKELGAHEQIRSFELLADEWTVDTGELTASLKLRRPFITKKYEPQIGKLFNKQID